MSEEPTRACPGNPTDPVMVTYKDLLDHAVACTGDCRREGVSCLRVARLIRRHREARRAARAARQ
jgi:hypothetical protein